MQHHLYPSWTRGKQRSSAGRFFNADRATLQHKRSPAGTTAEAQAADGAPFAPSRRHKPAQTVASSLAKHLLLTSSNGKRKAQAFHVAHTFIIFVFHIPEDVKLPKNAFYLLAWKGINPPLEIHRPTRVYRATVQIRRLPPTQRTPCGTGLVPDVLLSAKP